jgi:hypothetical protein
MIGADSAAMNAKKGENEDTGARVRATVAHHHPDTYQPSMY